MKSRLEWLWRSAPIFRPVLTRLTVRDPTCAQLRKLHKRLRDYAPSQARPEYFHSPSADMEALREQPENGSHLPWWFSRHEKSELTGAHEETLIRVKSRAEDLAELNTPKVHRFIHTSMSLSFISWPCRDCFLPVPQVPGKLCS